MQIKPECITCIFSQALKVAKNLHLDKKSSKKVLDEAAKIIPYFDLEKDPPQNAVPMYEMLSKQLNKEDIYEEIKLKSIQKANTFVPFCEEKIKKSDDKLLYATKIAVAGNVIDLASEVSFDLKEELEKILDTDFVIDNFEELRAKLKNSKKVVYLADNAGENIFDKIYIKTIRDIFPDIEIFYFVRGKPIINDVTEKEAYICALDEVATIIDSGVPTPGIVVSLMNKKAKEIFENAECIISKGMGNYECLSEEKNYPIFFLLKIKCQVVAKSLQKNVGDIICKRC